MACIKKRRGRWVIDFYDQQGVRRWRTMPKGATKSQADKELQAIKDQVERGNYLPVVKVPLFSEVAQEWIEHKRLKLRETTWEVYGGTSETTLATWIISKSPESASPRWKSLSRIGRSKG